MLLDFGGTTELLHLASSGTAAELWVAKEAYRNARFEIVGAEDDDGAGEVVIFASPNTWGHSPKARLEVTMTKGRSESWPPDCAKQMAQFVRCPLVVCLQTTRGENDDAHAGQIIRHPALFAAAGLGHQIDEVEEATPVPVRMSARAIALPCVLPVQCRRRSVRPLCHVGRAGCCRGRLMSVRLFAGGFGALRDRKAKGVAG